MATSYYDVVDTVAWNFWSLGGAAIAMIFSNAGSAYGAAKSGMGIAGLAVTRPQLAFKALVPVIMAGILSIYGLIIAVLTVMAVKPNETDSNPAKAAIYLVSGLVCGLSQLAAGYAIGLVGEQGTRSFAMNEQVFVPLILILIFCEVLGLFGMIIAIIMTVSAGSS